MSDKKNRIKALESGLGEMYLAVNKLQIEVNRLKLMTEFRPVYQYEVNDTILKPENYHVTI
jgi:hypothetical protein